MHVLVPGYAAATLKTEGFAPFQKIPDHLITEGAVKVNLTKLDEDQISVLHAAITGADDSRSKDLDMDIKSFLEGRDRSDEAIKRKLIEMPAHIRDYLIKEPDYRVWQKIDGAWQCCIVTDVRHHHATKYQGEYVSVHLAYYQFGHVENNHTVSIHGGAVRGPYTMREIMEGANIYKETDELREMYLERKAWYDQISGMKNKAFIGRGVLVAKSSDRWSTSVKYPLDPDGNAHVVIMEDPNVDEENRSVTDISQPIIETSFWSGNLADRRGVAQTFDVPFWTTVKVFDLSRHVMGTCDARCLKIYEYDTEIADKLVLPQETMDLIDTLMHHDAIRFEDIISGKGGGSIVLACGQPGVGKTLTAEVYSEVVERPLYVVQCSQLGISAEKIEENLNKVLGRAMRWGAILLLDEIDVYIRERGDDIEQNAIVGVFLRLLERYQGILFMTTNRGDIVDDAIASRCIARVEYDYPTQKDQARIWRVLADVSGIEIDDETIQLIVDDNPVLSGRDVKNLLRLSALVSKRQEGSISMDTVRYVRRFLATGDPSKRFNGTVQISGTVMGDGAR